MGGGIGLSRLIDSLFSLIRGPISLISKISDFISLLCGLIIPIGAKIKIIIGFQSNQWSKVSGSFNFGTVNC